MDTKISLEEKQYAVIKKDGKVIKRILITKNKTLKQIKEEYK